MSYQMINRWKRDYLAGGFEGLVPVPRQASPRTPGEVLALAAALERENPERTAAQVQRILRATGWAPSDRTLQRLFSRLELSRPAGPDSQLAFGRFEASRPNELWTGDALHGPVVGGRKRYLFCFIDDHSRAVMGARTSRRLPFRLLLALDVIVQRALLQRRHVYDDLAPVGGVVANRHPLAGRQGELDLGYPVRVAELLSASYLREALRLRTATGCVAVG